MWHGTVLVERLPRLRGRNKHGVNYRHVIDWLVRKPGAFERYRYREDLFPTSRFRVAYDALVAADPAKGQRITWRILQLAATENETAVDECLPGRLMERK